MYRAFVINLERRPDRYADFKKRNQEIFKFLYVTRVIATDGLALDLAEYSERINPWLIENRPEARIRGVIACALSHLRVLQEVSLLTDDFALIFEDDARLINKYSPSHLRHILSKIPKYTDLVWLSDYDPTRTRIENWCMRAHVAFPFFSKLIRWNGDPFKTAEAYVVAPNFARKLYSTISENMSAFDSDIRDYVRDHGEAQVFCSAPPIFTQANRNDSNIR